MSNKINKFIDLLIREAVSEHPEDHISSDGYYKLEVIDIADPIQAEAINYLVDNDNVTRDLILDRLHDLIQSRLDIVYAKDQYIAGKTPIQDQQTGEIKWEVRHGVAS